MKGSDFIRTIRRLGRKRGIEVVWEAHRGKGDHGTLYFGGRRTVVGDLRKDLKTGTLHGMLRALGLTLDDLRE
jgi:mRNA interferase HicA